MPKDINVDIKNTSDASTGPANPSSAPEIKPIKRPKPLVEGINSPKTTQDISVVKPQLTNEEQELISTTGNLRPDEPRLMPAQVTAAIAKKHRHVKGIILTGILLLVLVAGGYEFYNWYLAKQVAGTLGGFPTSHYTLYAGSSASGNSASSSLTTATASSTLGNSSGTPESLTPVLASSTPAPAPAPGLNLKINSTPTGYLNVRTGPSISNPIITKVHPGESYPYTDTKNGWYKINLPANQSGWVSGQYVTTQ